MIEFQSFHTVEYKMDPVGWGSVNLLHVCTAIKQSF